MRLRTIAPVLWVSLGAASQPVALGPFSGPKNAALRRAVVEMLEEHGLTVLRPQKGRAVDVSATIRGAARKKGRAWSIEVEVLGRDGSSLGTATFHARSHAALLQRLRRRFWKDLGDTIEMSTRDPEPEPPVESPPPQERVAVGAAAEPALVEEAEPGPSDDSGVSDHAALDVSVGGNLLTRKFRYSDDLFESLRPYDLGSAFALAFAASWYPAAHFTSGWATNVGITGSFERAMGLSSSASDGSEFPTTSQAVFAGLIGRVPLGGFEVTAVAGYGGHEFSITDASDTEPKPDIPSVHYRFFRAGLGGRVPIGPLSLTPGVSYRKVLSAGEIESDDYFARLEVTGIDLSFGVAYAIWNGFDVRGIFELRRYAYTMNSLPGDARVAGGAVDQYLVGGAAIGYRMAP